MDIRIFIAGSAGEGIQTIGSLLAKVIQEMGYSVFTWQEFESRIRGGQNSYRIRISEQPKNAPTGSADILMAMNKGAVEKYLPTLREEGIVLSETSINGKNAITIPFTRISKDFGKAIYANTVATGALCGMLGIENSKLSQTIKNTFLDKGESVVRTNLQAAEKGHRLAKAACEDRCPWRLSAKGKKYYLMPGHETLALASVYAGCRFISAYPMSPSTNIITWMSQHEDAYGILAEQAEDEIAAINMAIGASFAGVRAMTATSGGGFALMTEGVSLAGMTETPVVIVLAQRPGPATGLPTRTAQGDLLFAINAGHGEFPKMVLAPADAETAFQKTVKAFNLAEKYQVPVILMTDQFLADAQFSYGEFNFSQIPPEFHLPDTGDINHYRRYDLSVKNGVSPRLSPGQSRHLVCADSDEHDESGHITEDLVETAPRMHQKRMDKLEGLRAEIEPPEQKDVMSAEIVLVGWGTTRGAILESIERLHSRNIRAGMIHFTEIWPLPDITFSTDKKYISVESNAIGQLSWLLKSQYGLVTGHHIGKLDGLPITADFITEKVINYGRQQV